MIKRMFFYFLAEREGFNSYPWKVLKNHDIFRQCGVPSVQEFCTSQSIAELKDLGNRGSGRILSLALPGYHFSIRNGDSIRRDEKGMILPNLAHAERVGDLGLLDRNDLEWMGVASAVANGYPLTSSQSHPVEQVVATAVL